MEQSVNLWHKQSVWMEKAIRSLCFLPLALYHTIYGRQLLKTTEYFGIVFCMELMRALVYYLMLSIPEKIELLIWNAQSLIGFEQNVTFFFNNE